MAALMYHSIQPDSLRAQYQPSDLVTFSISVGEGRALLNSSVKLEGNLEVQRNGVRVGFNDDIRIDPFIGAHALFAEVNTESVMQGVIEQTGPALNRAVRQLQDLTKCDADLFTGRDVAALRSPDELISQALLRGTACPGQAGTPDAPDYSVSPVIALNRATGPIAFAATGQIRVTVRLATVADALFGGDCDANTSYYITNFRLTCHSVPASLAKGPVTMRGFSTSESTVQTRSAVISTRLPAVCESITASMIPVAQRGSYVYNTAESARPVNIEEMVLQLNDTVNGRISAPLEDEAEILRLALAAVGGGAHNSVTPQQLAALRKWHVGYPLGAALDLSRTPFTLTITADSISNATPWVVTIIGHTVFSL